MWTDAICFNVAVVLLYTVRQHCYTAFTQVGHRLSFLVVTHPRINRSRRCLTTATDPLSKFRSPPLTFCSNEIKSLLNTVLDETVCTCTMGSHLCISTRIMIDRLWRMCIRNFKVSCMERLAPTVWRTRTHNQLILTNVWTSLKFYYVSDSSACQLGHPARFTWCAFAEIR